MSDFYVTLPSHSSKTEFPDNTSNSFKIRLPHPIRFEAGGWKVGLMAVSLPDVKLQKIGGTYYPSFFINVRLAVDIGWFKDLCGGKYGLGSNITIEIPNGTILVPRDTGVGSTPSNAFWRYGPSSGLIRMTMT